VKDLKLLLEKHIPGALVAFRTVRSHARNLLVRPEQVFSRIYAENGWASAESRSGPGSTLDATKSLRANLPGLLRSLSVRTLLDAPCGEFWLRDLNYELESYVGVDLVKELIEKNQRLYGTPLREFRSLNLTRDELPAMDLVLCRDLLIHLSFEHGRRVLENFRRSGSTWLLCSQYPDIPNTHDIKTGGYRAVNLLREPFAFPVPVRELADDPPSDVGPNQAPRRTMALWRLAEVHL
jgi:hypothetical protein